jgi:hypothetical protein
LGVPETGVRPAHFGAGDSAIGYDKVANQHTQCNLLDGLDKTF